MAYKDYSNYSQCMMFCFESGLGLYRVSLGRPHYAQLVLHSGRVGNHKKVTLACIKLSSPLRHGLVSKLWAALVIDIDSIMAPNV